MRAHERRVERVVDSAGAGAEFEVAAPLVGTRERGDCVGGPFAVGEKVKRPIVGPGVTRERLGLPQCDVGVEGGAGIREYLLEHMPHREDGGSGVEPHAGDLDLAHLAAGSSGALDDSDIETAHRKIECTYKPCNACADHYNFLARRNRHACFGHSQKGH